MSENAPKSEKKKSLGDREASRTGLPRERGITSPPKLSGRDRWARDLNETLQSISDYTRFVWRLHPSAQPPGNIFWCLRPAYEAVLNWEANSSAVTYTALGEVLGHIQKRLTAPLEPERDSPAVRNLPVFPAQPRFVLATSIGGIELPQMTPEQWEQVLKELEAFLKALIEKIDELPPEQKKKVMDLILAVITAIKAVRDTGASEAALEALKEALIDLINFISYCGQEIAAWVYSYLYGMYLRILAILGGEAGGGAAAGGFVLVDLLILLIFLVLWALAWIKIGNWLWNQPVAGSSQTYIDWWGARFYDFYKMLAGKSCDELLDEWIEDDRQLRNLEASGADFAQVAIAAIHAGAAANVLLKYCPNLGIAATVKRRIEHYEEKIREFDKAIEVK